jgi:AraC-like DNA-binding protein
MAGAGKPGQRGYVVTDHNRKLVHALAATGRSQDEIARHIGCSDVTLRRYYRDELNTAATEATLAVEQSVHWMATKGRNLAAAQFWLRNRGGDRWREPGRAGEDQQPATVVFQWAEAPPHEPPTIEGEAA